MENKQLYQKILKNAFFILIVATLVTLLVMRELSYGIATLLGGFLSITGFLSIIMMTHSSLHGNVKARFTSAYLIRYLLYFLVMYLAMKAGLNIISILIGFLCISLSIKINEMIGRKEENGA